jgi:uncharacterized protein (DUF2267 family)
MGYREMIKKVQKYSGFSDSESKDALDHMVESLAVHLTEGERKDFSSQLPHELQDIALTVQVTEENSEKDIVQDFMENQDIDEPRAKKQIFSAWHALKDALTEGEINHIRAQLPNKLVGMLH